MTTSFGTSRVSAWFVDAEVSGIDIYDDDAEWTTADVFVSGELGLAGRDEKVFVSAYVQASGPVEARRLAGPLFADAEALSGVTVGPVTVVQDQEPY